MLLDLMIDAVEDYAIYMLDIEGNIISWNSGAERNSGYTASEVVGQAYACLFPPEKRDAGAPQRKLDDAKASGRVRTEGWHMRKNGTRFWAVATLTAVRNADGAVIGFAHITRDLTDRHDQEVAVRLAMEEAEWANKAKSDFLANMSHELRTPLNAILGFSEMIVSEISGPIGSKNREYASHIHSSGNYLLSLINDLLDLSKLDANQVKLSLEEVKLSAVAQEAVSIIGPQAATAGVQVHLETVDRIKLRCDDRRILQVFLNLLSNAIKFTPEGGRVTLRIFDLDSSILMQVEDTGIGMEPDEIPVALSRFGQIESTMSRKSQGTGLGLPLVKQLVEMHSGTLVIFSQKGIGTRVDVEIPKPPDTV
jgi:PAS domain S-box-containing protein